MSSHYSLRVTKDYLVFSAGHFITFDGDTCERLHGHNYRVACELTGPLDSNGYIFDFIALRDRLKEITDSLDHRMLIPTRSDKILFSQHQRQVVLQFEDRKWSFPADDCVLLAIENTTTELLAQHIAERLIEKLQADHGFTPRSVAIEVEECFGQAATYHWAVG